MGKCIVNPSEVSFKGGETKDAKPPGVGGGHGEGGREGLLITVLFFLQMIFYLFIYFWFIALSQKHYLKGYLGNRVSNGFP